jgi:hypothetical protein
MATDAMTLTEYGEMITELAEQWDDDEEPIVLVGDITGNVNVTAKDGYTKVGTAGFAQELFESNGVHTLGNSDWRFYGTVMVRPSDLADETVEQIEEQDYEGVVS